MNTLKGLITLKSIVVYLLFITKWAFPKDFDTGAFIFGLLVVLVIRSSENIFIKTPLFQIKTSDKKDDNHKEEAKTKV